MTTSVEVLVVGAGQAGLTSGHWLMGTSLSFAIVDGASQIGDSWRQRWDSLRLFTPTAYSSLPGMPMPGEPWGYPTKDAVAEYLEHYADHFRLPVRLGDPVVRLEHHGSRFRATLASGDSVSAATVIVATGVFRVPVIPSVAQGLSDQVTQLDPRTYRSPQRTPAGTVLVVGDGATGRQIALDLAATHRVLLATGRARRVIPSRILGRSIFWWLDRLGVLRAPRAGRIGARLMAADPFPGRHLSLRALNDAGVSVKPRLVALRGRRAEFEDGQTAAIDTVIWAAGYRDDTRWLRVEGALDARGRVAETEGRSPVPGLYYVGRSWQRTRASALLLGVGEDAREVVDDVITHLCHPGLGRQRPAHHAAWRAHQPERRLP